MRIKTPKFMLIGLVAVGSLYIPIFCVFDFMSALSVFGNYAWCSLLTILIAEVATRVDEGIETRRQKVPCHPVYGDSKQDQ